MPEEALQTAMNRREAKGKGEKEGYAHLNAEFQRIARRDKKDFFSNQCKEIEENNRMGKTRDLFKKIGDTKGTFHAKMSPIKDRNGMDQTEAEEIKKTWQEYTEEYAQKGLNDPDKGFPGGTNGKEPACQCRRHKRCGFKTWVGKDLWRRKWQPTPVFFSGKFQGQRSLLGFTVHRVAKSWV